ncbi:MAG: rod shape-determining protein MreC [Rhizomicrobium sp.]|jgi:rod shape-determining protein MreC
MANGTWKIARRNGGQFSLAVFVVLAIILVLVGRAQPALFNRARAYFSDWTSPALEAARVPVNVAGNWLGGVTHVFTVYQENIRLKQENARLRQWQNAALVLEQRLKRYQLLLNAVPDPAVTSVTAHVIGHENRPFLNTIILDAGKHQTVKSGEAVVDDRGMIGRIFLAGDHTSWVVLVTDLNSRIPVTIEPGNIQAMLSGDNTAAPTLEVSAQGAQLKEGEQIVTSGDGGLLPANLPVGVVYADGETFRAALYADSATADDVRILDLKLPPEEPPAPSPSDLPIAATGAAPLAPPPPKPAAAPVFVAPSPVKLLHPVQGGLTQKPAPGKPPAPPAGNSGQADADDR